MFLETNQEGIQFLNLSPKKRGEREFDSEGGLILAPLVQT